MLSFLEQTGLQLHYAKKRVGSGTPPVEKHWCSSKRQHPERLRRRCACFFLGGLLRWIPEVQGAIHAGARPVRGHREAGRDSGGERQEAGVPEGQSHSGPSGQPKRDQIHRGESVGKKHSAGEVEHFLSRF